MRPPGRHPTADLLVPLAMLLPTAGAWVYFVRVGGGDAGKAAYAVSKLVQFSLPVLWLAVAGWPRIALFRRRGLAAGLASGIGLGAALWLLYLGFFQGSPELAQTTARIRSTLAAFGLDAPLAYAGLAAGLSLLHSLLEELYWRWFVYQRVAAWLPPGPAVAAASLAFASHHAIVAARYAPPSRAPLAVLLATLAVAAAGALWCRLFARTGSVTAPWLSHLLVDAALTGLGAVLLWG